MTDLKIGDVIPNAEALRDLPIGTAISTLNRDGYHGRKLWTKHTDEQWGRHQDHANLTHWRDVWHEGQRLISLPGSGVYTGPMAGEIITDVSVLDSMPIGSTICAPRHLASQTRHWILMEGGRFYNEYSGDYRTSQDFRNGQFMVKSISEVPNETVRQFGLRFRDLAIAGSERARGDAGYATKVLNDMGVDHLTGFEPSVGLTFVNQTDRQELPDGTRVFVGNPENVSDFGVYEKRGRDFVQVFGEQQGDISLRPVTIDLLPGETEPRDWFLAQPTTEDVQAIADLRALAWKHGWAEKQNRGWCNEFERIMLRGGITAEVLNPPLPGGHRIGALLDAKVVAELPEGTWLSSIEQPYNLYKRVGNARNQAGTVRVIGDGPGHFTNPMRLVSLGGPATYIPIPDEGLLNKAPVGTVVSTQRRAEDGTFNAGGYIKVAEYDPGNPAAHIWATHGGGHRARWASGTFAGAEWYIVEVP